MKNEKNGYKEFCGEDCVEDFAKKMLEVATYMKHYFEKDNNLNFYTKVVRDVNEKKSWLREKRSKEEDEIVSPNDQDHDI